MKRLLIVLLALSFYNAPARGDTEAALVTTNGQCAQHLMCDAQTATGVCTVLPASGDERTLFVFGKWSRMTFFGNGSVGTPWTCDVMGNMGGYDAESGDGVKLNTTSLSNTQEAITLREGDFGYVWVTCPTIGTSVTITVSVCPSSR